MLKDKIIPCLCILVMGGLALFSVVDTCHMSFVNEYHEEQPAEVTEDIVTEVRVPVVVHRGHRPPTYVYTEQGYCFPVPFNGVAVGDPVLLYTFPDGSVCVKTDKDFYIQSIGKGE